MEWANNDIAVEDEEESDDEEDEDMAEQRGSKKFFFSFIGIIQCLEWVGLGRLISPRRRQIPCLS